MSAIAMDYPHRVPQVEPRHDPQRRGVDGPPVALRRVARVLHPDQSQAAVRSRDQAAANHSSPDEAALRDPVHAAPPAHSLHHARVPAAVTHLQIPGVSVGSL